MAITIKDLRNEVALLNKKFKKTNNTAVKFDINSAYGGHQIVLKTKGAGVNEVTYGHHTPKETINSLEKKSMRDLRYLVDRTHKTAMDRKKNRW